MKRLAIYFTLVAALLALIALAPTVHSQTPAPGMHHMMMPQHQDMMDRMNADDKKLDELLAEMNQANGDRKVDLIAAIVTELVNDRNAMHHAMQSCPMN